MKLPEKLTRAAGKTWLAVKRRSPEILFFCGTASFVAAIVSAVKASSEADQILADHEGRLEEAKCEYIFPEDDGYEIEVEALPDSEDEFQVKYPPVQKTQKQINRDIRKCYVRTGLNYAKLYSKTAGFAIVSLACFGGAYRVLSGRVSAGIATIQGLQSYISDYENRNIKLNGEESHEMCKYGYREVEVEEVDPETGEVKVTKKLVPNYPGAIESKEGTGESCNMSEADLLELDQNPSVLIFDKEHTHEYKGIANLDKLTVVSAEEAAIHKWRIRGWVTENDVRSYLGMEETVDGQYKAKVYLEGVEDHGGEPSLGIYAPVNASVIRDSRNGLPIILETNFTDNLLLVAKKEQEKREELEAELRAKRLAEEV